MPIWMRKTHSRQTDNPEFEIELENTLRPVEPDPEFRQKLHSRLTSPSEIKYAPQGIDREQFTLILVTVLLVSLMVSVAAAVARFISRLQRR
jgi:hypothetical protein